MANWTGAWRTARTKRCGWDEGVADGMKRGCHTRQYIVDFRAGSGGGYWYMDRSSDGQTMGYARSEFGNDGQYTIDELGTEWQHWALVSN